MDFTIVHDIKIDVQFQGFIASYDVYISTYSRKTMGSKQPRQVFFQSKVEFNERDLPTIHDSVETTRYGNRSDVPA